MPNPGSGPNTGSTIQSVAQHLATVKNDIAQFERTYGRSEGSVKLLAVSKTKPASLVREAASEGQIDFGENYVEEGVAKRSELDDLDAAWHYIGHIQSNKTRVITAHYDWVQSVDRLKIAGRLAQHRSPEQAPLNICIQLNIDDEESKSGCSVAELEPLAEFVDSSPTLILRGLMAIPAPRTEPDQQRKVFARLHSLYQTLQSEYKAVDTLSMGMSGDMEAAIAEGATMVRIGTAVFGARQKRL